MDCFVCLALARWAQADRQLRDLGMVLNVLAEAGRVAYTEG